MKRKKSKLVFGVISSIYSNVGVEFKESCSRVFLRLLSNGLLILILAPFQNVLAQTPSATTSTVTVSPPVIPTNGTTTITVQLNEANGTNLSSGGATVSFVNPSSGSIGSVTDNGNGTYTAIYTASTTTGSVTITPRLTINSTTTNFSNTASVTVGSTYILDGTSGNNTETHTFSTNGNITLSQGFFADYLIVGGGGGGGSNVGGGGGAGGIASGSTTVSASNYAIGIGSGGGGGTGGSNGNSGGNTTALGVTANGGTGGIGGNSNRAGGTSGAPQSRSGGSGWRAGSGDGASGGGGAGAGANGSNGNSNSVGGKGGAGIASSITGSNVNYGGGGGGGSEYNFSGGSSAGAGGAGGGGAGGLGQNNSNNNGGNASGYGSGGGGGGAFTGPGGTGHRGLVILRYKGKSLGSVGGTVTAGTNSATGYTLHQFTSTGNFNLSSVDMNDRLASEISTVIPGSGNLTFSGSGTLTLTGSNTYTGQTIISSGSIEVGNGGITGRLGSGSVELQSNSSLIFNRIDDQIILNDLSFSATGTSLFNNGPGKITFSNGSNTGVSSSTIQIGGSGTLEFQSPIGSGESMSLVKKGNGLMTLSSTLNNYTGTTTIEAGTLMVDGNSGTGAVSVENGALLSGSGNIKGATTIKSGGTIMPGSGIKQLTIDNDMILSGGGNYNWKIANGIGISGSDWDHIQVNGALTINATNSNKFNINVWSILANGNNGEVSNFNPTESAYTWTILTTTGGITNFAAYKFNLVFSAVNGTNGFQSRYNTNGFKIVQDGNLLKLQYDPASSHVIDATDDLNINTTSLNFTTNNLSGTLTLGLGFFAEYFIVGGGGGGGSNSAGGGGAGGVQNGITSLTANSYPITIGAGGSGGVSGGNGTNGVNTSVFGITAGGGFGASRIGGNSGSPQSKPGGVSWVNNSGDGAAGGGGAGAGLAGSNGGRNSVGGKGGSGYSSDITGSPIIYAGGGGGGNEYTAGAATAAGAGSNGGGTGGRGTTTSSANNATSATTFGSGGGGGGGFNGSGGNGAAGVAIIRYKGSSLGAVGGSVTAGSGTASGYTIHTFNASGSFNMSGVSIGTRLRATLSGNIIGTGNLVYNGPGILSLTGINHTYTGATEIKNGELRVNSDISSSSGVNVDATAALSGTGTLPTTTINGVHNPGDSPGLQTFSDLTYGANSTLNWELATNSVGTRGTDYDAINVNGNLDFAGATTLNLIFDASGSAVDWMDTFWDNPALGTNGWKLFEVAGTTSKLSNLRVNVIDWKDGQNVAIAAARAGYAITFDLHQDGKDVYLTYDIRSTNATLSGLSLALDGTPGTLSPTFDPTVFQYIVSVTDGVTTATVSPTATNTAATITVDGTVVASGNVSTAITLNTGATLIPVVVTAADGVTSLTYNLIISAPLSANETVVSFKNTGTTSWTAPPGVHKVQVLVVGGGGGGAGRDVGGGGGAGGLVFNPNFEVTPGTSYTVTVGAGGAGGTDSDGNRHGRRGGNSIFGSLTAQGGGGAAGYGTSAGTFKNGGSGGGGAGITDLAAGTGASGEGNNGGAGEGGTTNYGGGGGGGAGQTGLASSASNRGKGGDGLSAVTIGGVTYNFINLFGTTHGGQVSGSDLYFAGGGGGAGHRNSGPRHSGSGGLGGGGSVPGTTGTNTPSGNGGAGLINTGGGGAASRNEGPSGGTGGSGVVIIRYSVLQVGQNGPDQLFADTETSGFVGLSKVGDNTVEMIGNSDFSGASVDAGTLLISNNSTDGALGDGAVQVATNSFFGVNRKDAVTLKNNILGQGGFVHRGDGITTFTNRQTYTGGTIVDNGTLVVAAGVSNTGTGGIVGALTVNQGGNLEYAGIRAFGYDNGASVTSLTINGGSVGNNFYNFFWNTGSTFPINMNGGTLVLGGDATGTTANQFLSPIITVGAGSPSQINRADGNTTANLRLRDGSHLTVNATAGSKLFVNVPVTSMSGGTDGAANGQLIKNGTGTVVLNSTNLYTGATTINEGTLEVNGSINSAITMSSSGVIAGSGTLSSVSLRGTISPGSDGAGTLTTGNVTLAGNTAYVFDLNKVVGSEGTDWDLLRVIGTLSLGSSTVVVNVEGSPGDFSFLQEYTWKLIRANSISGFNTANWTVNTLGFSAFTGNAEWSVEQSGMDILLRFTPKSIVWPGVGIVNGIDLTQVNDNITIDPNKTLVVEIGAPVDYLVVAGGGSGAGRDVGGGGGGGGVLSNLTQPTPNFIYLGAGTYTVKVGAGGQGRNDSDGVNGQNSEFGPFTAIGGGGGGYYASYTAPLGGSGGGGGRQGYFGGPGVKGQGFAGGNGSNGVTSSFDAGGGGGGAGGPGRSAMKGSSTSKGKGGDGGAGVQIDFTGTPSYFGGGGGGAPHRSSSLSTMISGVGGIGGGGDAAPNNSTLPQNGQDNTGGGGGASRSTTGNLVIGGSGGSGIVQVRYPAPAFASGGNTISGSGTANGFTIHSFTSTESGTFEIPANGLKTTYTGTLSGGGNLEYNSLGTLVIAANQSYTGASIVKKGELRVNADLTSSTGLKVEVGAILSGTGDLPPLDVFGKHRPGNSPGVQRVHGSATYRNGAVIEWELNSNDPGLRGYDFDGIDVQGDLIFEPGAELHLVFNERESRVNWEDAFWGMEGLEGRYLRIPRRFKLFQLSEDASVIGLEHLERHIQSGWKDHLGRSLGDIYPDHQVQIKLIRQGNTIYLDLHLESGKVIL